MERRNNPRTQSKTRGQRLMTTFTSEDRVKAEQKHRSYYYTPDEWSRSIGYGVVPDERNIDLQQLPLDLDYSQCK